MHNLQKAITIFVIALFIAGMGLINVRASDNIANQSNDPTRLVVFEGFYNPA
jgi:hypothetical protein